jgi:hypothetical protein
VRASLPIFRLFTGAKSIAEHSFIGYLEKGEEGFFFLSFADFELIGVLRKERFFDIALLEQGFPFFTERGKKFRSLSHKAFSSL